MLPTNPQSMSTADKSILENLREQGAQIDRQTRVMEKLVDRIARMMTAEEKIEKKNKRNDREIKGDTKIKDVPGLLIDKLADKLDDSITKQFLKIKDSFKKEKQEPIDRSKEPALTEKEKEKKSKDETDTLRTILNSMVSNSKYQEQMTENSKALQSIADKTLTNVDNLNDNLKNIEQPDANTTEKENKTEEKNNKKEGKLNNNQKLAIAIGASIAAALKPQFDTLGKTLKEALERGFAELVSAIDNMSSASSFSDLSVIDAPDGKGGKGGNKGGGKGNRLPKLFEVPGLSGKPIVGGSAAIGATIIGGMVAADQSQPETDAYFEEQRKKKEAEEAAAKAKRTAQGKVIQRTENSAPENQLKLAEIKERDAKIKDGKNTNIDSSGRVVIPKAPAPVMRLDNISPAESKEKQKLKAGNDTQLDIKDVKSVLGENAVAPNRHPLAEKLDRTAKELIANTAPQQIIATDKMSNDSKAAAKAAAKRREENERLKAAESIDPKALEWARKYYKDDNIGDSGYLSQEKNKSILEFLKKHEQHLIKNPNFKLEPEVAPEKKLDKTKVNQQKTNKIGMLDDVTNEKVALTDSKKEQPIIITNNNTNTGGGSDPAPIAFGSASPRNTSTSINDYFRNNGKLHDAAYG